MNTNVIFRALAKEEKEDSGGGEQPASQPGGVATTGIFPPVLCRTLKGKKIQIRVPVEVLST